MEESSGETGAGSSEGTVSHVLRDDHGSGCARKEFLVENAKKEEHGHRSLKPSKRLELLVRLNRAYPDRWCESSLKQLLRAGVPWITQYRVICGYLLLSEYRVLGQLGPLASFRLFPRFMGSYWAVVKLFPVCVVVVTLTRGMFNKSILRSLNPSCILLTLLQRFVERPAGIHPSALTSLENTTLRGSIYDQPIPFLAPKVYDFFICPTSLVLVNYGSTWRWRSESPILPSTGEDLTFPDRAIAKLACSRENVPRTMEQIEEEFLFSLAQICAMQHEKLMASQTAISEKEKKFISAIMSLQQEKSEIKQGLARQNMFVETLLQDFDEIAKALENSRQKQRQLEQLLEQKDTDLHLLISEKEELVNKFVTSGSDAVLKGEGKFQDSVNAETSAYDLLGRGGGSKENNNMCDDISSTYIAFHNGSKSIINTQRDDFVTRLSSFDGKRPTLLFVILNGIFEEGLVSVLTVVESGIFALPSAVAHFWLGVTSRVARHVSETVVRSVEHFPFGVCLDFW
eukprot:Gb_18497 [translate_table: standard]